MVPQAEAEGRGRAQLLKLDEVAARLRVSRRYVDELVRTGRLRAVRISRRVIRVREFDLVAFCSGLPAVPAMAGAL